MSPWEEVRTSFARAQSLQNVLLERACEAAGRAGVREERSPLRHWATTNDKGDLVLRNSREDWSPDERDAFFTFATHVLGFRSVDVRDWRDRHVWGRGP